MILIPYISVMIMFYSVVSDTGTFDMAHITILIVYRTDCNFRAVKWFVQDHIASSYQSWPLVSSLG